MAHKLGEILVKAGKITEEQLTKALKLQKKGDEELGEILVQMGAISDENELSEFIGKQLNIGALRLSDIELNPEVVRLIPLDIARKFNVIAITKLDKTLIVAISDPKNMYVLDAIKFITGYNIQLLTSSEKAIQKAIDTYYKDTGGIDQIKGGLKEAGLEVIENLIPIKPLKQCLDESMGLLNAVLDAYDEEVERETYLNLLKDKIEDLWGQRDKYNRHFLDVVVQLKVVSRILDYEVLSETQIQSIKKVVSLLKKIELTREDRLVCWKTLEGSGIDLNAPIRGSENFELVLREKQHRK